MGKYSFTLEEILTDGIEIFPSVYPGYWDGQPNSSTLKSNFEQKFKDFYYYDEIGYDTVDKFKQRLKSKLNIKMPFYKDYYDTYLQMFISDMMNSKNLKETTERTYTKNIDSIKTDTGTIGNTTSLTDNNTLNSTLNTEKDSTNTLNRTGTIKDTGTENTTNSLDSEKTILDTTEHTNNIEIDNTLTIDNESNVKISKIEDGVSSPSLSSGYLTEMSQVKDSNLNTEHNESQLTENTTNNVSDILEQSGTNNITRDLTTTNNLTDSSILNDDTTTTIEQTDNKDFDSSSTQTNNLTSQTDNSEDYTENVIFESIGDIGIQTPAYAIEEWRKVIINIDEMILEDCRDLFMLIY